VLRYLRAQLKQLHEELVAKRTQVRQVACSLHSKVGCEWCAKYRRAA
jgi:hypothetical protein